MQMTIDANTKISQLLKQNDKALEAIISISPKFEKLRNPILRKIMAGRTSLSTASKFGGCTVDDFFRKLEPLGFEVDRKAKSVEDLKKPVPSFINFLRKEQIIELDVRPVISSGSDPLKCIMEKVRSMEAVNVLKVINSFEPTPLIIMLEKKGFETYVDEITENNFETYFYKTGPDTLKAIKPAQSSSGNWESILKKCGSRIREIDVRNLEMPQPMLNILEALDNLKEGYSLYVYHKRIPVFLLPELTERRFDYRIKEMEPGEVHILIFRI